jgi:hypothetical protein
MPSTPPSAFSQWVAGSRNSPDTTLVIAVGMPPALLVTSA